VNILLKRAPRAPTDAERAYYSQLYYGSGGPAAAQQFYNSRQIDGSLTAGAATSPGANAPMPYSPTPSAQAPELDTRPPQQSQPQAAGGASQQPPRRQGVDSRLLAGGGYDAGRNSRNAAEMSGMYSPPPQQGPGFRNRQNSVTELPGRQTDRVELPGSNQQTQSRPVALQTSPTQSYSRLVPTPHQGTFNPSGGIGGVMTSQNRPAPAQQQQQQQQQQGFGGPVRRPTAPPTTQQYGAPPAQQQQQQQGFGAPVRRPTAPPASRPSGPLGQGATMSSQTQASASSSRPPQRPPSRSSSSSSDNSLYGMGR
jgi:serine/threonine-protein kinase